MALVAALTSVTGAVRDASAIRPLINAFVAACAIAILAGGMLVPTRNGAILEGWLLDWCRSDTTAHAMSTAAAQGRPASQVTTVAVSDLGNGNEMTTLLVKYPPYGFTPRHRHGGAVTAYVLKGTVRSHVSGQALADFKPGQTFFEPVGSIHLVSENPSQTEPAELLATIVHPKGATLTTFID